MPEKPVALQGDALLDTRGLLCPQPVIRLARRIRELPGGTILEIQTDDETTKADIPAWCTMTGHKFLGREDLPGSWKFFVEKAE